LCNNPATDTTQGLPNVVYVFVCLCVCPVFYRSMAFPGHAIIHAKRAYGYSVPSCPKWSHAEFVWLVLATSHTQCLTTTKLIVADTRHSARSHPCAAPAAKTGSQGEARGPWRRRREELRLCGFLAPLCSQSSAEFWFFVWRSEIFLGKRMAGREEYYMCVACPPGRRLFPDDYRFTATTSKH